MLFQFTLLDSEYDATVSIGKHPFGNEFSYIRIITENGYKDSIRLLTRGDPSYTFHVPPGYGDTRSLC